ncbi:MAG: GatB/YqeY domain-containing protein [Sphingomonadales bacterium]
MLRDELKDAMKAAMKDKEARKLATVRLILAAVKDRDISLRTSDDVPDDDKMILDILGKMIKQRRDSITAYEEGGRCELAEQEREEIAIIEMFMPRQLSDDEVTSAVAEALTQTQAQGLKDMGKVMGALKAKYAGQMDFGKAGAAVRSQLSA